MRRRCAVVAAVLASALVAVGCVHDGGGGSTSRHRTSVTTTAPTSAASVPGTVSAECARSGAGGAVGDHAVGRADRTVVDVNRPTDAPPDLADRAAASRTLPLVVLYPARGSGTTDGQVTPGAEPSKDGPYPLLVHSHGLGGWGDERITTLARWASAGYVVVAPTFPLSSRSTDPSDLSNQPADVAFVVQQIRAAAADRNDVLHGLVRSDCVALSGHSLGGGTSMAAAYSACCDAIHPKAVVDIAGVLVDQSGQRSLGGMAPIPVLLVHGDADRRVPYAQSLRKVSLLHGPTWLLTFTGAGHSDMFLPPRAALLDDAVVAFLDATLQGAPDRLDHLGTQVDASGLATLQALPAR